MSFIILSDTHLSESKPDNLKFLVSALSHKEIKKAQVVCLLGDIFDFFYGDFFDFYYSKFKPVFNIIQELRNSGVKVIYVYGNHDFRVKNFFQQLDIQSQTTGNIEFIYFSKILNINNLKIDLSHGDLERSPKLQVFVRRFLNSNFLYKTLGKILGDRRVDILGLNLSKTSYEKRKKKKINMTEVRNYYRHQYTDNSSRAIVVRGHSHISDFYQKDQVQYLNNGYPIDFKYFIKIDPTNKKINFVFI